MSDQKTATTPLERLLAEAVENLEYHQWWLAYEGFREAVFHRLGAQEAHHHDNLPEVLEARDWLGLGEARGRELCAALALDYRMACIWGGCYGESFRDLYGEEESAREARAAAEIILARCEDIVRSRSST